MKSFINLILVLMALLVSSCSTPELAYFKDVPAGQKFTPEQVSAQLIRVGDRLSIVVHSRDQQLSRVFNLQIYTSYNSSSESFGNQRLGKYHVDDNGCIDFPVLGNLYVAGKTCDQVADSIQGLLVSGELLKDAIVSVDLLTQYYSVMGEVARPGRFSFEEDRVTILDALSKAGDLTMYGQRDNLLVVRQTEGGKYTTYRIDLTDANQIYSSPVFYLQKNDMVYVSPNKRRARDSSEFGSAFMNPSLWISAASFLTSICVLVFRN